MGAQRGEGWSNRTRPATGLLGKQSRRSSRARAGTVAAGLPGGLGCTSASLLPSQCSLKAPGHQALTCPHRQVQAAQWPEVRPAPCRAGRQSPALDSAPTGLCRAPRGCSEHLTTRTTVLPPPPTAPCRTCHPAQPSTAPRPRSAALTQCP